MHTARAGRAAAAGLTPIHPPWLAALSLAGGSSSPVPPLLGSDLSAARATRRRSDAEPVFVLAGARQAAAQQVPLKPSFEMQLQQDSLPPLRGGEKQQQHSRPGASTALGLAARCTGTALVRGRGSTPSVPAAASWPGRSGPAAWRGGRLTARGQWGVREVKRRLIRPFNVPLCGVVTPAMSALTLARVSLGHPYGCSCQPGRGGGGAGHGGCAGPPCRRGGSVWDGTLPAVLWAPARPCPLPCVWGGDSHGTMARMRLQHRSGGLQVLAEAQVVSGPPALWGNGWGSGLGLSLCHRSADGSAAYLVPQLPARGGGTSRERHLRWGSIPGWAVPTCGGDNAGNRREQ